MYSGEFSVSKTRLFSRRQVIFGCASVDLSRHRVPLITRSRNTVFACVQQDLESARIATQIISEIIARTLIRTLFQCHKCIL